MRHYSIPLLPCPYSSAIGILGRITHDPTRSRVVPGSWAVAPCSVRSEKCYSIRRKGLFAIQQKGSLAKLALHREFGFPRRLLGIVCFKHKGLLVRIAVDKPVVATWTCHAGKCWLDRFLLEMTVGDQHTAVV